MSREYKNIDDLFRSELMEEEVVVPDFVKANIDAALGFNKSKKYFYFLGTLLVLITGATLLYLMQDNFFNEDISKNSSTHISNNTQLTTNESTNNPSTNKLSSNGNKQNTNNQNNETSITSATRGSINSNSTYNQRVALNGTKSKKNQSTSTRDLKKTTQADRNHKNPLNKKTKGTLQGLLAMSGSKDRDKDLVASDKNDAKSNSKELGSSATNLNDNLLDNAVKENDNDLSLDINQPKDLDTNNISNQPDLNSSSGNPKIEKDRSGITPVKLIELNNEDKFQPWMLTMTSGISFANSNYFAVSPLDADVYNTAFSDRIGNQTSIDMMFRFKKFLTIGTGIGLTNYSDNYNFELKTFYLDSVLIDTYSYYEKIYGTYYSTPVDTFETVGAYSFVKDSFLVAIDTLYYTYEEKEFIENFKGKNNASYFALPLQIGIHFSYKKFEFDLLASARFNFLLNSSGGYLLNNEFTSFTKSTSIYKPFYIDQVFSSHINYALWKNLYLCSNIQYRPRIGTSFENVNFNKTFDSFHLGLGIGIKL